MNTDIILTPTGHLCLRPDREMADSKPDPWERNLTDAFHSSQEKGLFFLGAVRPDKATVPSVSFWRDFSCRYLTSLCRIPEYSYDNLTPIDPPSLSELEMLAITAPPMPGGEYLRGVVLHKIWIGLDSWVREDIASAGITLGEWLKKNAPLWHQVGRVSFHLAENRNDPEYPFAFLATYAPYLSKGGRLQYQPLGKALKEYAGEQNKQKLIRLLSPVYQASEKSPLINDMVKSGDVFHPLAWTPMEAYQFLQEVPVFEESGLLVRLPDWWKKRSRPRVSVTIGQKDKSRFGTDAMLDYNVELALGDQILSEEELKQLTETGENLIYFKGQWVDVDRERLLEALEHWKYVEKKAARGEISFIEGMRLLAGAPADLDSSNGWIDDNHKWAMVKAGDWLQEVLFQLRNPESLALNISGSNGLKGELRPYQEVGHNWLWFLSSLGLGACLADDMGLGKTVQVISLLLTIKNSSGNGMDRDRSQKEKIMPGADNITAEKKPSLLVLPASLLPNWKSEIKRFAPDLKTVFVHPSESAKGAGYTAGSGSGRKATNLSDSDLVVTTYGMLLRQNWLFEISWKLVILDEAQAIKNPVTGQTKAVKKLKADSRIALTGTPIENNLTDLWSLFDFLSPGLLGSHKKFKTFVRTLDEGSLERYTPLRKLVAPYILRRMKTDKSIISDLPEKTEVKAFCGLSGKQAALYGKVVNELSRALKDAKGIKRRGLILSYLTRFKQLCNHPSHLLGNGIYKPEDSGKFNRLKDICEEIASRQEKLLLFTQYREITEPLAAFLNDIFDREGLILHGGTPVKKRKEYVDMFQREEGPPFFVLSLKAGGIGLNLTEASHVIHFDRWWNPAVENQATDRAFRIGQRRNVLIHKFVCRGTIEERIDTLIEEKKQLADDILEAGAENILTEMNDRELLDMISLDIDRAVI